MLLTDIHIRAFTGSSLKRYLHSIAKLRVDVFREYPYLQEPNLPKETEYLKRFCACRESIGVLVFDNTTLVGASLGIPLSLEVPEYKRPFEEKRIDISSYFCFSESALLKNYRGRGIGHHFFDVRETHVVHCKKYTHISFCVPKQEGNDPLRPKDYLPLNDFWRKRGYIHYPYLTTCVEWRNLGETTPKEHPMTFWIKEVPPGKY